MNTISAKYNPDITPNRLSNNSVLTRIHTLELNIQSDFYIRTPNVTVNVQTFLKCAINQRKSDYAAIFLYRALCYCFKIKEKFISL